MLLTLLVGWVAGSPSNLYKPIPKGFLLSDMALFVLKRDVELQPTQSFSSKQGKEDDLIIIIIIK